MLIKQGFIDNEAIYLRTGREPVHRSVIIRVVIQISAVVGRGKLGIA